MVDKIACFLTCGYTEAGAMQAFLGKINDGYKFKQYLPNNIRKRKGDAKTIDRALSGLTGEGLLEKIYEICKKHKEEILKCKAILIEDDLDGRFFGLTQEKIEEHDRTIFNRVYESLGTKDMPIFLLYASPEIESWFIADWDQGFQRLYCDKDIIADADLNPHVRKFFALHLKQYLEKNILKEFADDLEEFGWFDGKYIKLSDQIIEAIQGGVRDYIQSLPNTNAEYVERIVNSKSLYYSKKIHGDCMLRNIRPEVVEMKCKRYFRSTYYKIKDF